MNKILNIFISHSSQDSGIVSSFVNNILQLGLGISDKDIYCSSITGLGSHAGSDFIKDIDTKLSEADLVFLLLTENFYESITCLQEMGAAWILNKDIIPLTMGSVDNTKKGHLLNTVIKVNLEESESLDNLNDTLKHNYAVSGTSTSQWNGYKNEFFKSIKPDENLSKGAASNDFKKSKDLTEKELTILRTIYSSLGHSISPDIISIKTKFKRPAIDILIKDLVNNNYLKNVGSDYQLTETAIRLIEGID